MFAKRLRNLLGTAPDEGKRLSFDRDPPAIYAIGDVHGRLDLLAGLEAQIATDAANIPGKSWLVTLGDLVDRGPSSAQVIERMLAPAPDGLKRYCLMGNHEEMLLEFIAHPQANAIWLENGGIDTLVSYGMPPSPFDREAIKRHIPAAHLDFIAGLPVAIETPSFILVHAGLRPGLPLAQQSRFDLLWYRDNFAADYDDVGKIIVHGHTPRDEALVTPHRIDVDTGAVFSGRLTAVRLMPGAEPRLFTEQR